MPNPEPRGDRTSHKVFRMGDRILDRFAFGQLCRDRGREGAPSSMRTDRFHFLAGVGPKSASVEQKITGIFFEMPAFHHNIGGP